MKLTYKLIFTFNLWLLIITSLGIRFVLKFKSFTSKKNDKKGNKLKILFLENQTSNHAGAYYRVEIVKDRLERDGINVDIHYPFTKKEFDSYNESKIDKHLLLSVMLIRKFKAILSTRKYDLVIVRRELLHHFEYGGLYFEKLLIDLNNHTILDMDDYMPFLRKNPIQKKSLFGKINLSLPTKAIDVLNLYPFFTVAMESFLADVRNTETKDKISHVFPMCVDYPIKTKQYSNSSKPKKIGWISQSIHFKRIDEIVPFLNSAFDQIPYELIIVAERPYKNNDLKVPIQFIPWSLEKELDIMLSFDIGIAPIFIKKEEQSKKGTFKLVQYMSLGLVSIVTDLPYTRNQIKDGYNGYLVQSNEDWTSKILQSLRLSGEELNDLGENAYKSFYKSHHIDNQYPLLRDFYKEVAKLN